MRCDCKKYCIPRTFREHTWYCILNDGFPYYLGYNTEIITPQIAINAVNIISEWYIKYFKSTQSTP